MIEVNSVTFSYKDGDTWIHALKGVNLFIHKGEWVSITGSNGSGKSTLARMFNGLLVPNKGDIKIEGLTLTTKKNREKIKQHVQVIFQNPDAQMIGTTLIEDIAFGLENRGVPTEEMKSTIEYVITQVGLAHKFNAQVSSLSGGQKQRLAIASCLALNPDYFIFDEATSMLDPVGRREIFQLAQTLWKNGKTVIWVTQRLEELVESPRIVLLEKGLMRFDGDARSLFYESDIPTQYEWDVPPIIKVGHALKEKGFAFQNLPIFEHDLEEILCEYNFVT